MSGRCGGPRARAGHARPERDHDPGADGGTLRHARGAPAAADAAAGPAGSRFAQSNFLTHASLSRRGCIFAAKDAFSQEVENTT